MKSLDNGLEWAEMPDRFKITYKIYSTYFGEIRLVSKGVKVKLNNYDIIIREFQKLAKTFSNDPKIYKVYELHRINNDTDIILKKLYIYHRRGLLNG